MVVVLGGRDSLDGPLTLVFPLQSTLGSSQGVLWGGMNFPEQHVLLLHCCACAQKHINVLHQ